MIIQNRVSDQIVDNFLFILKVYKQMRPELNIATDKENCSKNAYQTPNILNFDVFISPSQLLIPYIPYDFKLELFHIHLIQYYNSGYQKPHDHKNEDFSFILYLSDSNDGFTCFNKHNTVKIKPEKGKIIFFPGDLLHWGEPNSGDKSVAVGSLRKTN